MPNKPSAGYDVVLAADGIEGLRKADEEGPFDLFVIDLVMPRLSGEEVVQRLRLRNGDTKVLYCTGYSARLFTHEHMLYGEEASIDKPFTPCWKPCR